MNSIYHICVPSYEEYRRILQKMLNNEDAALCCASVIWRPSQLSDYYKSKNWEGRPLGQVFKNIGLDKASEVFYDLTVKKHMSEDEAWLEVYSKEVAADCPHHIDDETKYERLKTALFVAGKEAIESFIGFLDEIDGLPKDAIENLMDQTYPQMPDYEFDCFYERYVLGIKEVA